jgi:hypothetical protein
VLIDLFGQTDAVIVQHLSDDKIEVGDADDKGDKDADEKARPDLGEAGHVVGRQVAEHEGGAHRHQELHYQDQVGVHLKRADIRYLFPVKEAVPCRYVINN